MGFPDPGVEMRVWLGLEGGTRLTWEGGKWKYCMSGKRLYFRAPAPQSKEIGDSLQPES